MINTILTFYPERSYLIPVWNGPIKLAGVLLCAKRGPLASIL